MSKELADALDVGPTPPEVRERFEELMEKEVVSPNNTDEVIAATRRGKPVTYDVDSWDDLWQHWQG